MYVNSIKPLNFNYNNRNAYKQVSFKGDVPIEDGLSKQTLDNTQFKKAIIPRTDEFSKSLPSIRKPNSKNDASSFTNKDLDQLLFERRYYI